MSCGISDGIIANCEDLRRTGGVNKRVYAFNIDELADTPYLFDGDGCISAINFDAYGGLYELTSIKNAHTGGYTLNVTGDGGNKYIQHDVVLKLFSKDCLDDQVLQDLMVAQIGIIEETNNKQFKLYGAYNGMDATAAVQNSGQTGNSDISDTLTFTGEEDELPKRVLDTDYETTKAYLKTLVI